MKSIEARMNASEKIARALLSSDAKPEDLIDMMVTDVGYSRDHARALLNTTKPMNQEVAVKLLTTAGVSMRGMAKPLSVLSLRPKLRQPAVKTVPEPEAPVPVEAAPAPAPVAAVVWAVFHRSGDLASVHSTCDGAMSVAQALADKAGLERISSSRRTWGSATPFNRVWVEDVKVLG